MKARKSKRCQIPEYIRFEGHNLRVAHSKKAARVLATDGKSHKRKRRAAGCVEGLAGIAGAFKVKTTRTARGTKTTWAVPVNAYKELVKRKPKAISKTRKRSVRGLSGGTFSLSAKQKRNLPPQLQRAIIASHRRRGERILN